MISRAKDIESFEENIEYKSNTKKYYKSLKYNSNIYSKNKSDITIVKYKSEKWKNKKSFKKNHDKENDINYSNCDYKDYNYNQKEKTKYPNNKKYINKYNKYKEQNENFEKNKNEKKLSIDFYDTTTQSNSSYYEYDEEKSKNVNDSDNNKNKDIVIREKSKSENNNKIFEIIDFNEDILKNNLGNINNILLNNFQNLNLNSNDNLRKSFNKILSNNNIDKNNIYPQKKTKNKKKKKHNLLENKSYDPQNVHYNKFNSVNNDYTNSILENTEILYINVKISKDNYKQFRLRRFDDLFLTVKFFCEINSIEEKLMRPIITMILCCLNSLYQIYNANLEQSNIEILKMINDINNGI